MQKTHGSLFSGIGGFDLAAERVGWQNIFQVEKDEFCTAVLNKNFPNVTRYGDIHAVDFRPYRGKIFCLSGGFPCQPFSDAGSRRGVTDDRFLWPEFERAICGIRPAWVVAENVIGIRKLALDLVCASLEGQGYAVQPFTFPASAVGSWQRRERVWIIAHAVDNRREPENRRDTGLKGRILSKGIVTRSEFSGCDCLFTDAPGERCEVSGISGGAQERTHDARDYWKSDWPEIVAEFCRDPSRLPGRVDRIKALGNSVVPQVATTIFNLINEIENTP